MSHNSLSLEIETLPNHTGVIATLILNRPEVGNAMDSHLINQMHQALDELEKQTVRCLILKSTGKHFCTGADLNGMKQARELSREDNHNDAQQLASLLQRLDQFPAPTLAAVQGDAYGGAIGLITACDIVIGTKSARFCLSEVKLGLIPAVISPYVIRAMGHRQARRYFLSAEPISSKQALRLNLIHERCKDSELEETLGAQCHQLQSNAPVAMAEAKRLIHDLSGQTVDDSLMDLTCQRIADIRVSEEAQEGLSAFLEKREPAWRKGL